MATQPKTSSKLLIPVTLLTMLAAGTAIISPRNGAETAGQSSSASTDSDRDNIRARELIFHSEDLRKVPEEWERTWKMEMPDPAVPYKTHGGVI
jgi:uncharacterized protein YfaQ (DUF2300 family)